MAALLEAGADVNARDSRGNTPLHAAWSNPGVDMPWQDPRINPAAVEELLRACADPLARNDDGLIANPADCELWPTPVFPLAADLAVYSFCMEAGADLGAADDYGNTVLHHAASNPDPAITTMLLGAGIDAGVVNGGGGTPLHFAALHENTAVVLALLEAGADASAGGDGVSTPLHAAARNETAAVVEVLLEAGADMNARAGEGVTALVEAVGMMGRGPNMVVIDALLEAGADTNIPESFFERTPLHLSLEGYATDTLSELTRKLLAHGADPNIASRFGGNSLYSAAFEAGPGVIRALVEAGGDPDFRGYDGESPLHPAAEYGQPAAITALVEAGADPDVANADGETPLHRAVREGRADNVAALVDAGAKRPCCTWRLCATGIRRSSRRWCARARSWRRATGAAGRPCTWRRCETASSSSDCSIWAPIPQRSTTRAKRRWITRGRTSGCRDWRR